MLLYSNLMACIAVVTLFHHVIAADKPHNPGLADEKPVNSTGIPKKTGPQSTHGADAQLLGLADDVSLTSQNRSMKSSGNPSSETTIQQSTSVPPSVVKHESAHDSKLASALENTGQNSIPNPSVKTSKITKYPIPSLQTTSNNISHPPELEVGSENRRMDGSNSSSREVKQSEVNPRTTLPQTADWTSASLRVRVKPAVQKGKTQAIKPPSVLLKGPPPPISAQSPPGKAAGWNIQVTPSIRSTSFIFVNTDTKFQRVERVRPSWQLVEGPGSTSSRVRFQGGYNYGFQLRTAPPEIKFITSILPGVFIFYGPAGYVLSYNQRYYQLPAWYILGDPLPEEWWRWGYDNLPYQCSRNYDALDASDCNQAFQGLEDYWDKNFASIPAGGKTAYGRSCKVSVTCLDDNVRIPTEILRNDADPLDRTGGANLILQSCVSQGRAGWATVAGDCSIAFETISGTHW